MEISLLCLLVFHKKDQVWRQINDGERQSNRVVDMMKKTLQDIKPLTHEPFTSKNEIER